MKEKDSRKAVMDFLSMMDCYDDDGSNVKKFKSFFKSFVRLKSDSRALPSLELMTILKEKKPAIYHSLKKDGKSELLFEILTDTTLPFKTAEERINLYLEGK